MARATIDEVRAFYRRWYHPSNAILSVSADIDEERVFELAERYFAPIADTPSAAGPLPPNPNRRPNAGSKSSATYRPRR